MRELGEYSIKFIGLSEGLHQFNYVLTNEFFNLFDFNEFGETHLQVKLTLDKKSNRLDFETEIKGYVSVNCDITDLPYREEIEAKAPLVVKFGNEFDDTDDEVWFLPEGDHQINLAKFFFELAVLSIPMKRIHPDVETGKIGQEILKNLEAYGPAKEEEKKEEIDPRWNKLKDLLE